MTIHPIKKDLSIYQGALFEEPFEYYEDDGETPIDLTGVAMRMQVRATLESAEPLLELTTENGGVVLTDAANGKFKLYYSAEDTDALDAVEDAVYDLEVVPASGEADTYRLLMGKMRVVREVTR